MKRDLIKIQELDKKDIAASIAQDHEALLELWDQEGIAIPPDSDPIEGIAALEKWLHPSEEVAYQVTKYEHEFKERQIIGDWAFEWGIFRTAAELFDNSPPIEESGKLLRILKRQPDGEWKVARAIWNLDQQRG